LAISRHGEGIETFQWGFARQDSVSFSAGNTPESFLPPLNSGMGSTMPA
jgi:hypothetical protein